MESLWHTDVKTESQAFRAFCPLPQLPVSGRCVWLQCYHTPRVRELYHNYRSMPRVVSFWSSIVVLLRAVIRERRDPVRWRWPGRRGSGGLRGRMNPLSINWPVISRKPPMCGAATSSLQRFLSNQWSPKRRTMAMRGLKKESPFSHLSSKFQQAPSPSPRPPTHIQTNLGIIRTLNSADTSRHAFSKEQIKTKLQFFFNN